MRQHLDQTPADVLGAGDTALYGSLPLPGIPPE